MASPPGENSYYPGSKSAKSISSSVPTTSKPIPVKQIQPNQQQNQNQQQQQQQRGEQQQQQFTSGGSEYALAFQRNGVINDASLDVWGLVRQLFGILTLHYVCVFSFTWVFC